MLEGISRWSSSEDLLEMSVSMSSCQQCVSEIRCEFVSLGMLACMGMYFA